MVLAICWTKFNRKCCLGCSMPRHCGIICVQTLKICSNWRLNTISNLFRQPVQKIVQLPRQESDHFWNWICISVQYQDRRIFMIKWLHGKYLLFHLFSLCDEICNLIFPFSRYLLIIDRKNHFYCMALTELLLFLGASILVQVLTFAYLQKIINFWRIRIKSFFPNLWKLLPLN